MWKGGKKINIIWENSERWQKNGGKKLDGQWKNLDGGGRLQLYRI